MTVTLDRIMLGPATLYPRPDDHGVLAVRQSWPDAVALAVARAGERQQRQRVRWMGVLQVWVVCDVRYREGAEVVWSYAAEVPSDAQYALVSQLQKAYSAGFQVPKVRVR